MEPGVATALLLSLLAAAEPAPRAPLDARVGGSAALASLESEQSGLFSRVAPSVVLLVGDGASGSGFVVTRDGLVLTNAHVVGQSDDVAVQLLDGRHGRGRVVARANGALDLALVRIPFDDVPPLPAGDPAALRAGTYAATVGHGGGAAWTFSTGLVANPHPLGDGAPMILAQMALRPGSSGGPLVDRLGRAVAVVTAGTRDASGVTFAIRIDAAVAAFSQLAAWSAPAGAPAPAPSRAPSAEEAALVAKIESAARVVDVSRLSAASTAEPAPAMVTVWEAPRPMRRAAVRAPVVGTLLPAHAERAVIVERAAPAERPASWLVLPVVLALVTGAATAGAVAAWARSRPASRA